MTPAEIIKATIGIGSKGHNQESKAAIPISKPVEKGKK
jgi:hypothetical protein